MRKRKRKLIKKLVNIFLISAIVGILVWLGIQKDEDNQIQQEVNAYQTHVLSTKQDTMSEQKEVTDEEMEKVEKNQQEKQEEKMYPKEEIIQSYKGYAVCAKLIIPTISLETYVIEPYSMEALNVSVTKFWGANPNQIGNFCVAGHNFKNANMFRQLKKVKVGDMLTIIDHQIGKIQYKVQEIQTVVPEDVSCLTQETYGTRQVTLITCTNDSTKRIIVKAQESKN